ncbi:MAG: HepT-like ribonuclease domain-containing protein [Pseudomonadota bacterium]
MPLDDKARIDHMLEAARKAIKLARNRKRSDLDTDELLSLGLTRLFEIIGEAAAHVSVATRGKYAEIPWAQIIGMRNRLIHGYDIVDTDVIWQTITEDLPVLVKSLQRATKS